MFIEVLFRLQKERCSPGSHFIPHCACDPGSFSQSLTWPTDRGSPQLALALALGAPSQLLSGGI